MSGFKKVFIFTVLSQIIFTQDFSINLNVSGGSSNYDLVVGFSPYATDDYDSNFDIFAPPSPPPPSFDAALFWNGDRYYTQVLDGDGDLSEHSVTLQLQYPEDNIINFSWDNSGWSELGTIVLMDSFGGELLWIDMTNSTDTTIDNPAFTQIILCITPNIEPSQNPFEGNVTPTPMSGIFQGQIIINEETGSSDDWIAAFDSDGNISGASALVIDEGNSYANLTIYGDDSLTEIDEGINDGENFHLKIWVASENIILDYPESFDCWYNNNGAPMIGCGEIEQIYYFGDEIEPPPVVGLVINEIHYNPSSELQGSDGDFEFLEIYNKEEFSVDLSGYSITLGIDSEFPIGSQINAYEYIIVAKNPDTYSGNGYQVFQYEGYIYNGGEELELLDNYGRQVDYVNYDDEGEWPTEPDGNGPSLELVHPFEGNEFPGNWGSSLVLGGTPGNENSILIQDENIVVTVDNVEAYEGYVVSVPIYIHFPDGLSANSSDVEVYGFSQYADFVEINLDESLPYNSNWTVTSNEVENSILIAMAGANSISGDGLFFSLDLELNDDIDVDFVSIIISSAVFDSGEEVPTFENGGIYILEPVPPSSSFLVEPSTGLFPLTTTFANTSDIGSGNSIQYEWNFGNGDISDDENPVYVYEVPGIYQVTLTVSTNHGMDTSEQTEIEVLALYGDVDMNDIVQSYDASVILQYLVGYIELEPIQILIGDVNVSEELSALDASYILQYMVGLVEELPVSSDIIASGDIAIEDQTVMSGELAVIPFQVSNSQNILSFEANISYDISRLSFEGIQENSNSGFSYQYFNENGSLILVGSSVESEPSEFELVNLLFTVNNINSDPAFIMVDEIKWNENESITNAASGQIFIMSSDDHVVAEGWNLISFDIFLMENQPDIVFSDLLTNDNLVNITGYDENGSNFYDPFGYDFLNTLTAIEDGRGYWVKVNEADIFGHNGVSLSSEYSIFMWENWNLIGYWLLENSLPEEAFSELIENNNLVYVTGFSENGFAFFDPNGMNFLNTLTTLENGTAYWIKLNESVGDFQYPLPSGNGGRQIVRNINPAIIKTNSCMFVNGTISSHDIELGYESKVNIFSENGLIVGEMEILEGGYLLTGAVYGDDKTTEEIDGAIEGERLIFKLGNVVLSSTDITFSGDMNLQKVDLVFSEIPLEFTVIGNFPNPFNPSTTIRYGTSQERQVNIIISDLLGKEVKSFLVSKNMPGYHSVVWNGKDNQDRSVSTGVYLYRIESEDFVQTKKMVLLR